MAAANRDADHQALNAADGDCAFALPAAGIWLHADPAAPLDTWLRVSRSLESQTRRHAWPARGFFADATPPPAIQSIASRHALVHGDVTRPLWFVPYRRHSGAAAPVEPPPPVVSALRTDIAALGAELARGGHVRYQCLGIQDDVPAGLSSDHAGMGAAAPAACWRPELACTVQADDATVAGTINRCCRPSRGLWRQVTREGYILLSSAPRQDVARTAAPDSNYADALPPRPVMPQATALPGDRLEVLLPATRAPRAAHRDAPAAADAGPKMLAILYEDADLLVVNKPAGVLVHPGRSRGGGDALSDLVCSYLTGQGHDPTVRPVGRLDRGTSGLMVFARTRYAHQALSRQARGGLMRRTYLALVTSKPEDPPPRQGQALWIDNAVVSPPGDASRYRVPRAALTEARIAAVWPRGCLIMARPHTGRTHQVRQHLAAKGLPLYADPAYGGPIRCQAAGSAPPIMRPALHAWHLSLRQPLTGRSLSMYAPVPPDLRELQRWLRQR